METLVRTPEQIGTALRRARKAKGYAPEWLAWEHALPISLSLPLQEQVHPVNKHWGDNKHNAKEF